MDLPNHLSVYLLALVFAGHAYPHLRANTNDENMPSVAIFLAATGTPVPSLIMLKLPLLWPARTGTLGSRPDLGVGADCVVIELEKLLCDFERNKPTRSILEAR